MAAVKIQDLSGQALEYVLARTQFKYVTFSNFRGKGGFLQVFVSNYKRGCGDYAPLHGGSHFTDLLFKYTPTVESSAEGFVARVGEYPAACSISYAEAVLKAILFALVREDQAIPECFFVKN